MSTPYFPQQNKSQQGPMQPQFQPNPPQPSYPPYQPPPTYPPYPSSTSYPQYPQQTPTSTQPEVYSVPYQPPPSRINVKAKRSAIIYITTLFLLIISMLSPWYQMKMEMKGSVDGIDQEAMVDMQMSLEDSEIDLTAKVEDYGESLDQSYKGKYKENIQTAMDITYYLTMISLILVIIALIFTGLASLGKMSNKLGLIFAVIALFSVLITLIYFPIGLPGAIKENYNEGSSIGSDIFKQYNLKFDGSFIGETSSNIKASEIPGVPIDAVGDFNIKWSWGPAYGWFLILGSFIFILIGIFIHIFGKDSMEETEKEKTPELSFTEQTQQYGDSRDIYSNKQSEDDFF